MGDLRGKPLDERGLARRLRAYGVKPKTIRTNSGTPRGYSRADLEDQWLRYLPSPDKSKTSKTSETVPVRPVADVVDVLVFPRDGEAHRRCQHCQGHGDLVEVHYGPTTTWLHPDCTDAWRAAYDELDIPGFLDRRGEAESMNNMTERPAGHSRTGEE